VKPKNFSTDKGKYSVVATFTNRNEVTHDREAPVLPEIPEEPEKKQRRLPFNQLGKRLRRKKAGSD
jgi:hypothetical protein